MATRSSKNLLDTPTHWHPGTYLLPVHAGTHTCTHSHTILSSKAKHRARECPHHEQQPEQYEVSAITVEVGYDQRVSAVQDV
jgi:hypothetical protein